MLGQVSKFNRYSFPFYCRDTKDYLPPEITLTLAGGPLGVVLSMSNCSTSQRQRSRGWLLVSFSLVWVLLALLYWRWWFVLGGREPWKTLKRSTHSGDIPLEHDWCALVWLLVWKRKWIPSPLFDAQCIQFPCWIQGMNALVASRGFIWQHEAGPYQHITWSHGSQQL